jgi:hypothetical protein
MLENGKMVETVKIRVAGQDEPAMINKADFDESKHELWAPHVPRAPHAPRETKEPARNLKVVKGKGKRKTKAYLKRAA